MSTPIRVLVVDDDVEDADLVRDYLAEVEERYRCTHAATLEAAGAILDAGETDVCLVDYRLGPDDGLDLLRLAPERDWRVPMIVLTGAGDRAIDERAMAMGAADYLVKGQLNGTLLARAIRHSIERRRTLEELEEARARAEGAARAKSDFLANMSHEIRTPLNAVLGMTNLLRDTELDETQREYLDIVHQSGDHLLSVLNDILDFSKIEAGAIALEESELDLRRCVEECIDLVAAQATRKGVELNFQLEPRAPVYLMGDAGRVRQILLNLLTNAIKFTPEGGEVLARLTAKERDDGRWQIEGEVRDTGIGISTEAQSRLFQAFSQADSSTTRRFGGTGLGLAISRCLAELMSGSMWVESTEGQGSSFFFRLRLPGTTQRLTVDRSASQACLAGKRFLVVDDNDACRRITSAYLRSWEAEPVAEASARVALERIDAGERFDGVLLDLIMPELDGIELAGAIRERLGTATPPLVLISALDPAEQQRSAAELERIDVRIAKPLKPARLFRRLVRLFETRERSPSRPEPSEIDSSSVFVLGDLLPLRVLLAEDNPVNQAVALAMLERLGYQADVAGDGAEAVSALERQAYDLVLMDIQMPVMDGLDATRRIRAARRPKGDAPTIVAMTAHATLEDRERCFAAGMDAYLSKPVAIEALADVLRKVAARPTEES